ncbi:glutaminyl-peptide cyclotransferase [Corynebacterium atrinae]|uniref:glutaminyl-peptide cyclotransferase n=1 Tax=Corynebacterium atrinae TaxID=1336740 RepID=UPI003F492F32
MSLRVAASAFALAVVPALALSACAAPKEKAGLAVEPLEANIITSYPFDVLSFTQGLEMEEDGTLLVGTGQWDKSRLYRRDLSGQELASVDLEPRFFGEGITRHGDVIWQLTWLNGIAIKRDAQTLAELDRVDYPGEGWGLCSFADELIMSDGTDELRHLDPVTFEERSRTVVNREDQEVIDLNELECVDGNVYANVFLSTDILRIDAATGQVTGTIDASGLPNNSNPDPNNVLNGIAHIPGTDRFLLSGKHWPDLYEVEFVPQR